MACREETGDRAYERELRQRAIRQETFDKIVRAAITNVVRAVAGTTPPLFPDHTHRFYGATGIHPKHLAIWFIFRTDADFAEAERTGLVTRITRLAREELFHNGYPAEVLEEVHVGFATDEAVQREAGGNYYHYFK